ncbi:ribosomal RNA small subunit methyltransferase A [Acutalibacter intestini]|uniref:ribosomal RNA small subunit methyltransferase A n=1 Tax=Acutalibacter intestini TaxID=3093659 RepID=UPI002AC9CDF7|nr:rRNA adenine N(6)-methyltransferase family protein [Acutalibacter sp. M00204]
MSKNSHVHKTSSGPGGSVPLWASQNFLTSQAVIRRLLEISDINSRDLVLEIGPGKGHITRQLLLRCGALRCAELDPALWGCLQERFGAISGFSLYRGDFLKMPLPQEPYKVFANIPFSCTTQIIRRLTEAKNPPQAAWLVVELGAAKRFAGLPGENLTSLSLRPFFGAKVAARVARKEFHPMPRVDAALLELRRLDQPDLPWEQQALYKSFLARARRQGLRGLLTKKQVSTALGLAGLPQPGRDANLEYVQWLCLFRCWVKFGGR